MRHAIFLCSALLLTSVQVALAQDVREAAQKAAADRAAAVASARQVEEAILSDRAALLAEVEKLETEERRLESELSAIQHRVAAADARREDLADKWSRMELQYKEISGNVRLAARDLAAVLEQSPTTAFLPERLELVRRVLREDYFPDIQDITGMADALIQEMRLSGEVGLRRAAFVGRSGDEVTGDVLTLGTFTTVYRLGDEVGFLSYSPGDQRLFALSSLPPAGMARLLSRYVSGRSESVIIDLSGGGALQQITQRVDFMEHIQLGGPVMIPIIAIAFVALGLILHKTWFLNRVHRDTDKVMGEVSALAAQGDWERCEALIKRHEHRRLPVIEVVADGLAARHEDRETLESIMQEAILREMPRVERGLSAIAIIGAVEPLLGLLGTVTGMIETFRVITLYGTGDPRLMSNGISEALITTEFGLIIAIPLMLVYTFLSRRSNAIIGDMEEKAVHLSNIIQRQKLGVGRGGTPRTGSEPGLAPTMSAAEGTAS
jgi:biopolymer transport protein ExbB